MRIFKIVSFFILGFFVPSGINAGEFALPVPIVFSTASNNAICSDTIQRLNRLLVEGKNVTKWLRPANAGEKHLAVYLKTTKYEKGLFSDTATVLVEWTIKFTNNFEQKVESKTFNFKSGVIGTRINSDYVMETTRDTVLKLKTDSVAEEKYSRYEKQDFWFSIMYPTAWKMEESKLGYRFTAKFLGNDGNIIVAVKEPMDFHNKIIGLIKESNLSDSQLEDLSHMMYDKVPGVSEAKVFITTLSNERSLGSTYYYKIETSGSTPGYMRVLKFETLHKGKFYKLEVSSQIHEAPQMADKVFDQTWPIFETAIKSFVFLPY